jgi:hypothetical protein
MAVSIGVGAIEAWQGAPGLLRIEGGEALAADPTAAAKLPFSVYSGYFVSNQFEPEAAASFVVLKDQAAFDQVFGVAMVMRDKSPRLPKDAFRSLMVVAAIRRGNAFCEYRVEGVTVLQGAIELRYTVTARATPEATYACPLIVSVPKGEYQTVTFVENGKQVKTADCRTNKET